MCRVIIDMVFAQPLFTATVSASEPLALKIHSHSPTPTHSFTYPIHSASASVSNSLFLIIHSASPTPSHS